MANTVLAKIKELLTLLWYQEEVKCLICGQAYPEPVCLNCQEKYFLPSAKRCPSCGKFISQHSDRCKDCAAGKGPQGLNKVIALGYYEGQWKEFIHKVKYKGQPYLLIALAEFLLSYAIQNLPPPDAVVPVPMHPNKLAERGFNQAEVLASLLSRKLGIPFQDYLVRIKDTVPQTRLGRKGRIQNLQGAFAVREGTAITEEIIWLVDDVTTTGASLGECANILRNNGVMAVYAVCLGAGKEE